MHPDFRQMALYDRRRDLERNLEAAFLRRSGIADGTPAGTDEDVVLRLCRVGDDPALERLAGLEGLPAPRGRHVVAEVGGVVVAARPLGGGQVIADPFRPTAHLLPLLELRASQIGADGGARRPAGILGVVRALTPARR